MFATTFFASRGRLMCGQSALRVRTRRSRKQYGSHRRSAWADLCVGRACRRTESLRWVRESGLRPERFKIAL